MTFPAAKHHNLPKRGMQNNRTILADAVNAMAVAARPAAQPESTIVTALSDISVKKRMGILFSAEMTLSPLVAGVALLATVAFDWGAYKYVPAVVWLVMCLQCLVTFRWRGLWFLSGLPIAFIAIEGFLVTRPPAPERNPPAVATGAPDTGKPLIIHNPDGTFTIEKQPDATRQGGQGSGLVIPRQVVVPFGRVNKK